MPKFVPVADPEAPRWEQDEAKLAKHRNFDSHVVARDQTEQRKLAAGRRAVWMCKGACARCGDSVWSNEPRVRVGRGYAHLRCPRAFDYYATPAEAAFRPRMTAVGAGSPLQRLDSVQIDAREYTSPEPLQRVPRVYSFNSFEAMTSRSL